MHIDDATEITKKVNEKTNDPIFQVMDDDYKIWNLDTTSYRDPNEIGYDITQKKILGIHENDIEIVSNEPRIFANDLHSKLSSAPMQIAIRMAEKGGEDKREDIGKLERLLTFAFEKGDEYLSGLLLPPLRESLIWYAMLRTIMAARILVYKDGDNVNFEFLPLDPRYLGYSVGKYRMLWSGYTTFRSAASLEDEYSFKDAPSEDDNSVIDWWEFEKPGKVWNGVVFNNDFLKKLKDYKMQSLPVLVKPVATRPPIAGEGLGSASIYAPLRRTYQALNKYMSIIATHTNLLSKQPTINYFDKQGKTLDTTVYFAESVLNLPKGHNELKEAPMKDISPVTATILGWLTREVENASLPHPALGSPPPSGTALNLVQEAKNIVLNPQLRLLKAFYSDMCRLIEEQLVAGKIKVDVKTEFKRKYYETQVTPVDLKKPHIIKVDFTAQTPWTQLDTYQIADMAKRLGLPDAFIHEHILKLADPQGVGDLSAIEIAEHSPNVAMLRAIDALIKAGRQEEAQQVMLDMAQMARQEELDAQQSLRLPETQTPPGRIS